MLASSEQLKRAGVETNGILECKFLPKTRTVQFPHLPSVFLYFPAMH
jgi:hypothetical protein